MGKKGDCYACATFTRILVVYFCIFQQSLFFLFSLDLGVVLILYC